MAQQTRKRSYLAADWKLEYSACKDSKERNEHYGKLIDVHDPSMLEHTLQGMRAVMVTAEEYVTGKKRKLTPAKEDTQKQADEQHLRFLRTAFPHIDHTLC